MNLIRIEQQVINNESVNAVSARELHEYLGVQSKFADWIKNRIEKYNFEENQDFMTYSKILEIIGRPVTEYYITLDMAKELAMVENNVKGKEARKYFIECEKQIKAKPITITEMLVMQAQQLDQQAKLLESQQASIKSIEHKLSQTDCNNDYYAVTGFANLHGIIIDDKLANKAGRIASAICRERGITVGDCGHTRWGKIGAYPEHILHEVFEQMGM